MCVVWALGAEEQAGTAIVYRIAELAKLVPLLWKVAGGQLSYDIESKNITFTGCFQAGCV